MAGESKCFTFTLYLGSHTHIFKIKIFNQNPTLKSIELLDKLGKKMILTKSCELWGFSLHLSVAAFESGVHRIYLLSWVISYLDLLNLLHISL